MMRKLEVAAFASNLRANQYTCTLLFGKKSGVSIPLKKSQLFVEQCTFNVDLNLQLVINTFCQVSGSTDEKYFRLFQFLQERRQPFNLQQERVICLIEVLRCQ